MLLGFACFCCLGCVSFFILGLIRRRPLSSAGKIIINKCYVTRLLVFLVFSKNDNEPGIGVLVLLSKNYENSRNVLSVEVYV